MQNTPINSSQDYFEKNAVSPEIGYKFNLNIDWMLSVSIGSKSFASTDEEDTVVSLAYVSTASEYLTRISYPFYLGLGYKFYYFIATDGKSIPLSADTSFSPEVGIAANISIYYVMTKKLLSGLSIESWRGVGSRKLNGLEGKFTLAYSL